MEPMEKFANISACGQFRYFLSRHWERSLPSLGFIMLNPSTADAEKDDATIRKCIGFAKINNFGSIFVVNLFARRTKSPKELIDWGRLESCSDIVGPDNDTAIKSILCAVDKVVVAWGAHGSTYGRGAAMLNLLYEQNIVPHCLSINKDGSPAHPLMLSYSNKIERFSDAKF
jgi:hypothetical protein